MIKRQATKDNKVKITFALPLEEAGTGTSVVGEFNNWDPTRGKLVKRANGTASATFTLDKNKAYRFRYYVADGTWLDDAEADRFEAGEHGSIDGVLLT